MPAAMILTQQCRCLVWLGASLVTARGLRLLIASLSQIVADCSNAQLLTATDRIQNLVVLAPKKRLYYALIIANMKALLLSSIDLADRIQYIDQALLPPQFPQVFYHCDRWQNRKEQENLWMSGRADTLNIKWKSQQLLLFMPAELNCISLFVTSVDSVLLSPVPLSSPLSSAN